MLKFNPMGVTATPLARGNVLFATYYHMTHVHRQPPCILYVLSKEIFWLSNQIKSNLLKAEGPDGH